MRSGPVVPPPPPPDVWSLSEPAKHCVVLFCSRGGSDEEASLSGTVVVGDHRDRGGHTGERAGPPGGGAGGGGGGGAGRAFLPCHRCRQATFVFPAPGMSQRAPIRSNPSTFACQRVSCVRSLVLPRLFVLIGFVQYPCLQRSAVDAAARCSPVGIVEQLTFDPLVE